MKIPSCSVIISSIFTAFFFLSIKTSANNVFDAVHECFLKHSESHYPISESIYSKNNSSYTHVLQSYLRNQRFNESFTPKPQFIITALHVSHIQAAVICGKKHGLNMRIRSGGHDYEGSSYVSQNPFFVLDMNHFRGIDVSIEDETARVGAGATLGELYYKIAEKSKVHAFPAGVCPSVGIGGHFSGGGYGTMLRKFGLSVDNVIDATVVDANGQVLNRSSMGEDLFWAINGGGGASFAVIVSYKIKLVRIPPKVTVFRVEKTSDHTATDIDTVTDIVHRWQEVAHTVHKDLFLRMIIDVVNGTKKGEKTSRATFMGLFLGESSRLLTIINTTFPQLGLQRKDCIEQKWIETILFFAEIPEITPISILLNRHYIKETYHKMKSDYLKKPMPKEGLKLLFKKMIELEIPKMQFNPYGGRMSEIPSYEKPFPHREGNIAKIQYVVVWNEGGIEASNHYIKKLRDLHKFMTPYVSKFPRESFYNYKDFDVGVNHNNDKNMYFEGLVYGRRYFKDNFARLVSVKSKVDPENFFRHEQSIPTKILL